jgi:glutamyl/glutaminyl-tRNA synthetase
LYKCFCSSEDLLKEREEQTNKGIQSPQYSEKCASLSKEEVSSKEKECSEFS